MVVFCKNMAEFNGYLDQTADGKLLVVDFTASWCPPCKMIAPIFEKLAEENPDAIFIKVDVDDAADVAGDQGISAMPTFKFFKNKTEIKELLGADPNKLKSFVAECK